MAQYIKKVGVTPTRANGFIIDSFNTGDNKHFNAPSINAVQEKLNGIATEFTEVNDTIELRADNNLLFAGDFRAIKSGGQDIGNGWTLERLSGSGAYQFAQVVGIVLGANTSVKITSPQFAAMDNTLAVHPISVSVLYKLISVPSGVTPVDKVAKFENIQPPYTVANIPTYTESGIISLKVNQIYGGYFSITATTSSYMVGIKAIKVEYGTACTPIATAGKDPGILDALSRLKSNTAPSDYITYQTFATPSATVQPGATATVQGEVTKAGYIPLGIIGYKPSFSSGYVVPLSFAVVTDSGVKKAQFMVHNPGSSAATFQVYCVVLYMKE